MSACRARRRRNDYFTTTVPLLWSFGSAWDSRGVNTWRRVSACMLPCFVPLAFIQRLISIAVAERKTKMIGKDKCKHTPCPEGYLQWHTWAEKKSKTHKAIKCPNCGRYAIWVPKRRK